MLPVRVAEVEYPSAVQAGRTAAERELVRTQRSALHNLLRDGAITAEAYDVLAAELDEQIVRHVDNTTGSEGDTPNHGTR